MRTPTVCCGSTCRRGLTCPCTRKPSSTKWLGSSTNDHARLWGLQLQPNDLMLVLHRPLEPAPHEQTSSLPSGSSEKCQQRSLPPFAERDLWNICSGSLGLDACELHHLAPLLGFLSDQLAEVSGRARKHRAAEISEPHFHVGVGKARVSFRVELVNNLRRCV